MHSTVHSSPIHSITQNVESLQNPETTVVATCPPVVIGVGDGGIMGARAPPPKIRGNIFRAIIVQNSAFLLPKIM